MSTLYLVYGVPHKSKDLFFENVSDGLFADGIKNLVDDQIDFDTEREFVTDILEKEEDIMIDVYNAMPSVFESWIDFAYNLGHKIKVIIITTPLDVIMKETDLDEEHMQTLYNNFISTIGWLYLNYKHIIINSAHL